MKTATFVWILIGALVVGGVIAALYFGVRGQTQVGQDVGDCVVTTNDLDGDCVSNQDDYFPYDFTR